MTAPFTSIDVRDQLQNIDDSTCETLYAYIEVNGAQYPVVGFGFNVLTNRTIIIGGDREG